MENVNLSLFISVITPLAMMLFIYKKEALATLSFLMCGIFICLFAGEVNKFIYDNTDLSMYSFTVNLTPITEELLKALPIAFAAFMLKPDRHYISECAVAEGVGFAILENMIYMSENSDAGFVYAVIRGFGAGMMHGLCTLAVGFALGYICKKRKLYITGTVGILSVAILYHSAYNIIIQSEYSVFGILLPLATFIPLITVVKKKKLI